jgi:hypothetical protein
MSQPTPTRNGPGEAPDSAAQAQHGYRNEVNWGSGEGRQPYSNQGTEETPSPAAGAEEPQGNRGERSGRTQEQLEQVKTKP